MISSTKEVSRELRMKWQIILLLQINHKSVGKEVYQVSLTIHLNSDKCTKSICNISLTQT